jgi:hypothetical protein
MKTKIVGCFKIEMLTIEEFFNNIEHDFTTNKEPVCSKIACNRCPYYVNIPKNKTSGLVEQSFMCEFLLEDPDNDILNPKQFNLAVKQFNLAVKEKLQAIKKLKYLEGL